MKKVRKPKPKERYFSRVENRYFEVVELVQLLDRYRKRGLSWIEISIKVSRLQLVGPRGHSIYGDSALKSLHNLHKDKLTCD